MKICTAVACMMVVAWTVRAAEIHTNELFDPNALQQNEAVKAYIAAHPEAAALVGMTNPPTAPASPVAAPVAANPKWPHIGDAVDVSFTSMDGKLVDVSRMKGSVVLVDYWATWCVPCRKGLTRMMIIYNKYHARGFDIVGISLDEDKDALAKLIHDRTIPWPQAFDGKVWESPLAAKYGIDSIPMSFLIGRDGKVAALNLRDDALDDKVAQLLAASPPVAAQ